MRIRAEYRSGADTNDPDNVALNGADTIAMQEPSTLTVSGASLLALLIGCR